MDHLVSKPVVTWGSTILETSICRRLWVSGCSDDTRVPRAVSCDRGVTELSSGTGAALDGIIVKVYHSNTRVMIKLMVMMMIDDDC